MARGKGQLPLGMTRREDGRIYYRFSVDGQRFGVYGFSVQECKEKEEKRREQIRQKVQYKKERITLNTYYEEWQDERTGLVKASTQYTQNRQYKHIEKSLGTMKLCEIEKTDVQRFQKELKAKKDKKTGEFLLTAHGINLIMSLLKQIMRSAVNDRIIIFNPCDGVRSLKITEEECTETIHRALTTQETDIFFRYATGSYYCTFFKFLLVTGMRTGEAAALQWSDIDYDGGFININKTVSRVSDREVKIDTPKTRESIRKIALTDDMKRVLAEHKAMRAALHPRIFSLQIFTQTDGTSLIRTANVSPTINMIVKKAQNAGESLERFGAHALRDTYATRAYESGMDIQALKKHLGHSSYKMTLDKYAQTTEERAKAEAGKVHFAV